MNKNEIYQKTIRYLNVPKDLEELKNALNQFRLFNLLCEDEIRFYDNKLNLELNNLWTLIVERVIHHNLKFKQINHLLPKNEGFFKFTNGSKVQGTINIDGIQPDCIIDLNASLIKNLFCYIENECLSLKTDNEKFKRIGELIRIFIDYTSNDDHIYLNLLNKYRDNNLDIPLSEYIDVRRGQCREISLLTHLCLEHLGYNSYYYYSKVTIHPDGENEKLEDHVIVLVDTKEGFVSLDNCLTTFDHCYLDKLQEGFKTNIGSMYFSEKSKKGKAKVFFQRKYSIFGIK